MSTERNKNEANLDEVSSRKPSSPKTSKIRVDWSSLIKSILNIIITVASTVVITSIIVSILPIAEDQKSVIEAMVSTAIFSTLLIYTFTKSRVFKLRLKRISMREATEIVLIGTATVIVNLSLMYAASLLGPLDNGVNTDSLSNVDSKLWLFVFVVLIAPVVEEILFRAIPYEVVKRNKTRSSLIAYFIVPGVIFSLMHYSPSQTSLAFVVRMVSTFSFALMSAYLYHKKENLTYNIALHATYNAIIVFMAFFAQS